MPHALAGEYLFSPKGAKAPKIDLGGMTLVEEATRPVAMSSNPSPGLNFSRIASDRNMTQSMQASASLRVK